MYLNCETKVNRCCVLFGSSGSHLTLYTRLNCMHTAHSDFRILTKRRKKRCVRTLNIKGKISSFVNLAIWRAYEDKTLVKMSATIDAIVE